MLVGRCCRRTCSRALPHCLTPTLSHTRAHTHSLSHTRSHSLQMLPSHVLARGEVHLARDKSFDCLM